jgi:hypothetical protein
MELDLLSPVGPPISKEAMEAWLLTLGTEAGGVKRGDGFQLEDPQGGAKLVIINQRALGSWGLGVQGAEPLNLRRYTKAPAMSTSSG